MQCVVTSMKAPQGSCRTVAYKLRIKRRARNSRLRDMLLNLQSKPVRYLSFAQVAGLVTISLRNSTPLWRRRSRERRRSANESKQRCRPRLHSEQGALNTIRNLKVEIPGGRCPMTLRLQSSTNGRINKKLGSYSR